MAVTNPRRRRGISPADSASTEPGKRPTSQRPLEPQRGEVVSQPGISYVASSSEYPFIRTDIILASTIDEACKLNGWQIWDDMVVDPTGAALQLWIKSNVLADGLTITARPMEPSPGSEDASPEDVANAEWARRYIKEVCGRLEFTDVDILDRLWELLDGVRYPHKLAELTYDRIQFGEFTGLPGWASLQPKPFKNYNLIYDEMNRFRGVLGVVPGGSIARWSGIYPDVSKIPNVIAPEKFALFMADSRDGIPRSLWNGVYQPWARLQAIYVELMRACRTMSGGKVAVVLGELEKSEVFVSPETGAGQDLTQSTDEALAKWGNSGTLTLMPGSTPHVFFPNGQCLTDFINAIKMSQREMVLALTTDAKALIEGDHGSGLSEEQADDRADPIVRVFKGRLCRTLNRLFYHTVKLARGAEFAYRYSPVAVMYKGEEPDFADNGQTYAALVSARAVFESQLDDFADKLGVRRPTLAEKQSFAEVRAAQDEATKNPPVQPTPDDKPAPKPPAKEPKNTR